MSFARIMTINSAMQNYQLSGLYEGKPLNSRIVLDMPGLKEGLVIAYSIIRQVNHLAVEGNLLPKEEQKRADSTMTIHISHIWKFFFEDKPLLLDGIGELRKTQDKLGLKTAAAIVHALKYLAPIAYHTTGSWENHLLTALLERYTDVLGLLTRSNSRHDIINEYLNLEEVEFITRGVKLSNIGFGEAQTAKHSDSNVTCPIKMSQLLSMFVIDLGKIAMRTPLKAGSLVSLGNKTYILTNDFFITSTNFPGEVDLILL